MKTYVVKPLPPQTWWERGSCRYLVLSYSLWARTIRKNYRRQAVKK